MNEELSDDEVLAIATGIHMNILNVMTKRNLDPQDILRILIVTMINHIYMLKSINYLNLTNEEFNSKLLQAISLALEATNEAMGQLKTKTIQKAKQKAAKMIMESIFKIDLSQIMDIT